MKPFFCGYIYMFITMYVQFAMLIRFTLKAFWVARKICLILVKEKLYIGMYRPGIYKPVFI